MASENQNPNTHPQPSVPSVRLHEALPPLPRIRLQIPITPYLDTPSSPLSVYTDDSLLTPESARRRPAGKDMNSGSPVRHDRDRDEEESAKATPLDDPPQTMYEYIRTLQRQRPTHLYSPSSNTFLSPTSHPSSPSPSPYQPYRDSPPSSARPGLGIITLSPLTPSSQPPSYEELYLQHPCPRQRTRLQELVRRMEEEPSVEEQIARFVAGLLFVAFTVVCVGMAFDWGRAPVNERAMSRLCGGRCRMSASSSSS